MASAEWLVEQHSQLTGEIQEVSREIAAAEVKLEQAAAKDEMSTSGTELSNFARQRLDFLNMRKQLLLASRATLSSGIAQGFAFQPDDSKQHAEALFQPFPEQDFPVQLDPSRLAQLLARAPAHLVPATLLDPSIWPSCIPPLFQPPARSQHHGKLVVRLLRALEAEWPRGIASELLYLPYWNDVGFTLPEFAGRFLEKDIAIHRGVEDDGTAASAGSRRDFSVTLDGLLLIGGAGKASAAQLKAAVDECWDKHRGVSAALYGRLGYILLTAVAADQLSVYAMPLVPGSPIEIIVPAFCIKGAAGRAQALLTFINITRWIQTVAALRLLPPRPMLPMFTPVTRPSPFHCECPASEHTTLELRLRSVRKEFIIPGARLQNLLDVYGLLNSGSIPGAISCTRMEVGGQVVVLQPPGREARPRGKRNRPRVEAALVELTLQPAAAALDLPDNAALRRLCADVLGTLAALHAHGFVHRDVSAANLLHDSARFLLIDWELAARIGAPVFWQAARGRLPPGVGVGTPWQPWMDLWQLGQAVQAQRAVRSPEREEFVAKLQGRKFSGAAEAQACLW